MILALDCREFTPGRITGIGRFLQNVLEEIASNRPHLSTVAVAEPDSSIPVSAPHIRVVRLSAPFTLYYDQVLLPRALRSVGSTAFFSPYYKAPLASSCPVVITIHDLILLQVSEYTRGLGRLYAAAFRRWASLLANRAVAVITDSEFSKKQIITEIGLASDKVHVFYLAAGNEFHPAHDPVRVALLASRYGITGPYLLALGNFLPHKNFPRLVEAYSALPETTRAQVKLVLAGALGGHRLTSPVSAETLNLPGVLLPGFIAAEDLPTLYSNALAVVCPSLVEGFGYAPLEAMACGTPVVCSKAGPYPEVAGDAVLYVDPLNVSEMASALSRIIADESLRRELSIRGLKRVRLYDSHQTTKRLVDFLERIAGGRMGT